MSNLILRGDTAANWAAQNPTLAAGEPGLETDTGLFKVGTGAAAWNALPYYPNADYNPGEVVIGTTVLTTASTSISISLPNDKAYLGFRLEAKLRSDRAAQYSALGIRFNNDTANNYQCQILEGAGTTISGAEFAAPGGYIGTSWHWMAAANAPAGYYGHSVIEIPFPQETVGWRDAILQSGTMYNTTATDQRIWAIWGIWRSTAAVTSVQLAEIHGGNWIVGSSVKVTAVL